MTRADEILLLQVRLLRLATHKWGQRMQDTAKLFAEKKVYEFIRDMYEEFHVQGDEANLDEVKLYLKR